MSDFSLSRPAQAARKTHFSSLLLSDFLLLCSFILSHPLYFSYFIFFSPYLIKVFSFLSPLFITTSLLLLALLSTLYPSLLNDNSNLDLLESNPSFLFDTYYRLTGVFRSKLDDKDPDSASFEELEAYKMVFDSCHLKFGENPVEYSETDSKETCSTRNEAFVDKFCSHESSATSLSKMLEEDTDEKSYEILFPRIDDELVLEEDKKCEKELETEVKPVTVVSDKSERRKEDMATRIESKVRDNIKILAQAKKVGSDDDSLGAFLGKISFDGGENAESPKIYGEANLASFGSMRREKEWRRTLACKLFEERHNADVSGCGEGMDQLWETYEAETDNTLRSSDSRCNSNNNNKIKNKKEKKSVKELYGHVDDDDDEDDDEDDGKLCCLQALKFSTGKMQLGMGRPNLLKISKAIKGIGWLHHVTKHGKKKGLN